MVKLIYQNQEISCPLITGSEQEIAFDISKLRQQTGLVTYDPGLGNTAPYLSSITFLNGEEGILRYRNYDVFDLIEKHSFLEVAFLLFKGHLPNTEELSLMKSLVFHHSSLNDSLINALKHLPKSHPMTHLSIALQLLERTPDLDPFESLCFFLAKNKMITSHLFNPQENSLKKTSDDYAEDFLHLALNKKDPLFVKALNALFIIHADHEQNCSTTALRVVASSEASLEDSLSAAVLALSGSLHGGANEAVINMLEKILEDGSNYKKYILKAKDKEDPFLLMGFGHRVYKNFDPRATIIKKICDEIFTTYKIKDPLLNLAKNLEEEALKDSYFVEKKLYPNVDFYSGILYKTLGIDKKFFTPMFAMGRMAGWLSHFFEFTQSKEFKIIRPRQIYK